jgi:hypothetical protein
MNTPYPYREIRKLPSADARPSPTTNDQEPTTKNQRPRTTYPAPNLSRIFSEIPDAMDFIFASDSASTITRASASVPE